MATTQSCTLPGAMDIGPHKALPFSVPESIGNHRASQQYSRVYNLTERNPPQALPFQRLGIRRVSRTGFSRNSPHLRFGAGVVDKCSRTEYTYLDGKQQVSERRKPVLTGNVAKDCKALD